MLRGLIRSVESCRNNPKLRLEANALYDLSVGLHVGVSFDAYKDGLVRNIKSGRFSSYSYTDLKSHYYYTPLMFEEIYEVLDENN